MIFIQNSCLFGIRMYLKEKVPHTFVSHEKKAGLESKTFFSKCHTYFLV